MGTYGFLTFIIFLPDVRQSGQEPIVISVFVVSHVELMVNVKQEAVFVTRVGAEFVVMSNFVMTSALNMVNAIMGLVFVSKVGMVAIAVWMDVEMTAMAMVFASCTRVKEMITKNGRVNVMMAGVEQNVTRDRRQTVRMSWTMTKVICST